MNRQQLVDTIRRKKSVLCVGLDTDPARLPVHLQREEDPVFEFNRQIIDATREVAVSYKLNTAFYEAQGLRGWTSLQKTLEYLGDDVFSIADAKRGDIGNTAEQYARTFFQTYPFDSVTVAPYMGEDSVAPFLQFEGKWAIVLGLTSNKGSADFQRVDCGGEQLYERVLRKVSEWGTPDNLMFVVGATQPEGLKHIRTLLPEHFLLVPGVGAQGGDVPTVCEAAATSDGGLLINVSRAIANAGSGEDFADKAHDAARRYQGEMSAWF
jgi:orotidine-5'-phosphate decarboxylase